MTDGILLLKFWIHISKAEQLKRFRDRSRTSYKQWKITDEDWRNRKRWDDYTVAVNDMVARTSTKIAPWTLVEGNDKNLRGSRCSGPRGSPGRSPEEVAAGRQTRQVRITVMCITRDGG